MRVGRLAVKAFREVEMASSRTTGPVKKREAVLEAVAEADRLGDQAFLQRYGYGRHDRCVPVVADGRSERDAEQW